MSGVSVLPRHIQVYIYKATLTKTLFTRFPLGSSSVGDLCGENFGKKVLN